MKEGPGRLPSVAPSRGPWDHCGCAGVLLAVVLCAVLGCLRDVDAATAGERDALSTLFTETRGTQWLRRDNWNADVTPCLWYGITCREGEVAEIDLSANGVSGNGIAAVNFTALRALTFVTLRNNDLTGQVPVGLLYLPQMRRVDLRGNRFTRFPMSVGAVDDALPRSDLWVTLSGNDIWCPVPPYVVLRLGALITDWNASQCLPMVTTSRTAQVTETIRVEAPVRDTAVVRRFNEPIGAIALLPPNSNDVMRFELRVASVLFELLGREEADIPGPLPPLGAVPLANIFFSLSQFGPFRGSTWSVATFTTNVTEEQRRDVANRFVSSHPSVAALAVRDVILVGAEGAELDETPAPTLADVVGSVGIQSNRSHAVAAGVLMALLLVGIILGAWIAMRVVRQKNAASYAHPHAGGLPPAQPAPPAPGAIQA